MRVPFARSTAPPAASPTGQPAPCANCAAPMAVGQDWCVACGTAVAGRFGRGPGLRSSLGVVGVTLLLVVGAIAAVYAAVSSDSKQATQTTANVPAAQTPVTPDVTLPTAPPVTPVTPPPTATAPVTTTPAAVPVAPKIPAVTPTPAPTAPVTVTPPKSTTTPTTAVTTPTTTTSTPSAKSAKILLDTDAASVYNPYGLPAAGFGDPAKAIDGDPKTSWTYQLDPSTKGKTLFGLAIDLKTRQAVRGLEIAGTAGMTVEFYGATGEQPVSITDPGWVHLANRRHIKASTSVELKTAGKSYRYLLVWITSAPTGVSAGTLGISELAVST